MDEMRRLITLARRRLRSRIAIDALAAAAWPAGGAALLLAVADRLGPAPIVPWAWVLPLLVALLLGGAAILYARRADHSDLVVAALLDERLDLRERLSNAVAFRSIDTPFAQAAVSDGLRTARDPALRARIPQAAPIDPGPRALGGVGLGLLGGLCLLLPQFSIIEAAEPDTEVLTAARTEVNTTVRAVVQELEKMPELNRELAELLAGMEAGDSISGRPSDRPEDIRRDGVRQMTALSERLDQILRGDQARVMEQLENMLRSVAPEAGPGRELAEALRMNDFAAAREALERMAQAAADASDPGMQRAVAEAAARIAAQLERAAQNQGALERMLRDAGLDPDLARNPEAMRDAIRQAEGLTDEQRQQLQQAADALQQACSMCQSLGEALRQMAQAGDGMMGDGLRQASEQLSELEQLEQLLRQAEAMQGMCQGAGQRMGQGLGLQRALDQWREQLQPGGGMGEEGIGEGGRAELAPTPTRRRLRKEHAPVVEGGIIARTLIEGVPIRGESRARLVEVIRAEAAGVDEAVGEEALPRRYRDAQRHYFGDLEARVRALAETPAAGEKPDAE